MTNTIFFNWAIALRVAKGFAVVALFFVAFTGLVSTALGMIMAIAGAFGVIANIFEAVKQAAVSITEFLGVPVFDAFEAKSDESDRSFAWEEIGGNFAVGALMAIIGGGGFAGCAWLWVMLLEDGDTETETENLNG